MHSDEDDDGENDDVAVDVIDDVIIVCYTLVTHLPPQSRLRSHEEALQIETTHTPNTPILTINHGTHTNVGNVRV